MSSANTSNCVVQHIILFLLAAAKCQCCTPLIYILLHLTVIGFLKCNSLICVCLSAGESGIYLHDYLHIRVLSEDSSVWVGVPWRRLFTELLEHIRLCHRLHGVRWAVGCRWISLLPKATAFFWPYQNNYFWHLNSWKYNWHIALLKYYNRWCVQGYLVKLHTFQFI